MTGLEQQYAAVERRCCRKIGEGMQTVTGSLQQLQHQSLARARALNIYQSLFLRVRVESAEIAEVLQREGGGRKSGRPTPCEPAWGSRGHFFLPRPIFGGYWAASRTTSPRHPLKPLKSLCKWSLRMPGERETSEKAPFFSDERCVVCGATFAYQKSGPGRKRRFCSADCKRERHKLQLRQYASEDRYGVRAARLDRRTTKRGPMLPLDLPRSAKGKTE